MGIYLDWASTAPICDAAKNVMINYMNDFGNPSSVHELGRQARVLIEDARERIAKCINAEPDEIYFTSGGSEANSWVTNNYITMSSNFEHHSLKAAISNGYVDKNGFIDTQFFSTICHPNAGYIELESCMMVNNEIGTIQPVKIIANIAHSKNMLFHTDAVQALPYMRIDVKDLNCDMLSASGHKVGSAKGVGFLYIKNGVKLEPLINGGRQENNLRGGTENVLGIISMAAALEDTIKHMEERNTHIKHLRDILLDKLLQIPGSALNGSLQNRVPGNINIRFSGVSGSKLVTLCSLYGIYISAGSACNEGISTPSHVLKAIGLTDEEALSSIRITIGHTNTESEINTAADIITALIERIRGENE